MAYVAALWLGSAGNQLGYGHYRCIGISSTIPGARRMSMEYIGKSRSKETVIMSISKETIKRIGIAKGESFTMWS